MVSLLEPRAPRRRVDPPLVLAAMRREPGGADRLVAAIWPACFRLAASVTGDRELAQDAAQEACALVVRKVHGLRNAAAFDAWLYRIVMREASRVRRGHWFNPEQLIESAAGENGTAALDVWRALAALPPELRDVVVLFYFDDLRSEEIAAVLGVRHPTVRTRLARARERLRGLLGDYRQYPLKEAHRAV
jgi:RNA polymerase sigma-70 factor, ECF subfamily